MTEVITKVVVDCSTGNVEYVPLTEGELEERALLAEQEELAQLAREAEATRIGGLKASAKAKLIAGEPLTEEEAELLLG